MEIIFKSKFKNIANSCDMCCLNDEVYEKEQRQMFRAQANTLLTGIMEESKRTSIDFEIAQSASERCGGCDYIDPKIKNHLETYGINL